MLELYEKIKQKRIEKGWSQSDLARLTGYSDKSMIAKIEAGKVDLPQSKIRAFANALGCSEKDLVWDSNSFNLSSFEKQLILAYRKSDEIDKRIVLRTLGLEKNTDSKSLKEA